MSLTRRLLLGVLIVVGVLVALVVTIIDARLRVRLTEQSRDELAREARLVASQWTAGTDAAVLARTAGVALGHRVTLIDETGVVIGDSEFAGAARLRLENHGARPEVIAARGMGVGSALRRSASAGDEELYVAVRAEHGVARVSLGTRVLADIVDRARRDVLLVGLLAALVAGVLAYLFSRSVSRPIVELRDVAQALAAGNLAARPALSAPGEIGDLAAALHRLAEQLGSRLTALAEEESLLAALFDSLNEGALAADGGQRIVRINETGRRLLGARAAVPFMIDQLPRERVLREALLGALAGRPAETQETVIGERTLALTARPLAGGGAVLALFDLTTIRRLETVRRDFVANVSHELRTPLTVISGFADTLAADDPPIAQRRQFAEAIRANTARMQRIVDELLDLSRIESGGWRPDPVTSDIAATAADIVTSFERRATEKALPLRVAIDPAARTVAADPTALRQVLSNLVDNAFRYTKHGEIALFSEPAADGVWIGIRDTGEGIGAEHLPRIFERFYRADSGRSRASGGTGLGLAIVRHLVEAHGGRVEASSVLGRGTTIRAFFPSGRIVP